MAPFVVSKRSFVIMENFIQNLAAQIFGLGRFAEELDQLFAVPSRPSVKKERAMKSADRPGAM